MAKGGHFINVIKQEHVVIQRKAVCVITEVEPSIGDQSRTLVA